jgi:uncharacterized protein YecT (DUF1311 family)
MDWGLAKDVAIFVAGLVIGPLAYFAKRRIERTGEQEDLEIKERLLKINKELKEQNLTPEDLKKLSSLLFAKLSAYAPEGEAKASVAAITHSASDRIVTQAEMNQGSYEEFEKVDLELKQALERLRSVLGQEDSKRLEEAQQAWLKFRKKQVVLAGGFYEGGSIQPLIHNVEAQALTEARAKELRSLYEELVSR